MTTVYLYDDAQARTFEPFASTRPISEMRAGTALIRERWIRALGVDDAQFMSGSRHEQFDEPGATPASGAIPPGSIVANARFVPALQAEPEKCSRRAAGCSMWRNGETMVAVRTRAPIDAAVFEDGAIALDSLHIGTGAIASLDGWLLSAVWDFIKRLPEQLTRDVERLIADGIAQSVASDVAVLGGSRERAVAMSSATIEPYVVIDVSAGPVFIGARSHVRAFTRLVGPCYIGDDVQVMGGDISTCAIGAVCRVRGELSNSIFLGHSNKGHDGFVGHSYLGRWVNLGASTVTSNLKNTYGSVALWTPSGIRDTGMQFLGTMFGDHVKTGIGLQLTTGTVLGAAANVYGNMPPKAVAPFSWGDASPYAVYQADKFLVAAERMMSRRHVEMTARVRRHLSGVHDARWTVDTDQG